MKKLLLLSAALLLVASTSLFAQPLADSEFTVQSTTDVGEGTDLGFWALSSTENYGVLTVDFTYNGTDEIEFYVAIQEKVSGTFRFLEGYAIDVVPQEGPQSLTWYFDIDGKLQDTTEDYPAGTYPLVDSESGAEAIMTYIISSQPKGTGGGAGFASAGFVQFKPLLVVGALVNPLSINDFEANAGFAIYKNPVDSVLEVDAAKAGTIEIISLSGKVLVTEAISSGFSTVNVEGLSSGIYLCRYSNASGSKTFKLVKN